MTVLSLAERSRIILDYEESMARRLASMVLEKPKPPIWMILIPVFFVFYASKLQEYKKGLQSFADHYLVSRKRALEVACEAIEQKTEPAIDQLIARADTIPEAAIPLYRDWITLLIDHYRNLLATGAGNVSAMAQDHYRSKTNFLLFSRQLGKAEDAFNAALLPVVEGESEDIDFIARRLQSSLKELHQKEVESLFA